MILSCLFILFFLTRRMHKQEKGLILVFRRVTKQKKKRDLRERSIYFLSLSFLAEWVFV
jgi:hypothetical protein